MKNIIDLDLDEEYYEGWSLWEIREDKKRREADNSYE